ncbi:MAG: 3-methyl-2-oxobutanoate hydroxymethyltransferase, partial [Acidobacteria bacterium]|nr:3-methyl-2-oxobutanoate hydroxymethyltransferase [Acidobacteriota bacterium]
TVPVTMDEMLHHAKAVAKGARRAFLVGDLPFMSYQADKAEAIRNAGRMLKEGLMDAVKLEGGGQDTETIRAMVAAGIPVMGHIGLTPQSISQLGGYRIQGRTAESAHRLLEDALALEEAGCFAVVLELVPSEVAKIVTDKLRVPTIGIGAGNACAGQVLVYHDMLGLFDEFQPRFVKRYAELGPVIRQALEAYRDDVAARRFPAEEHTYEIPPDELEAFRQRVDG